MNILHENKEFAHVYQDALQLYEKSKKRLAEGDADDALTAARKSLEFFLKTFCKNCGFALEEDDGKAVTSEDLINRLKDAGLFHEKEISLFHAIRKLGNVGSHELAELDKAQEAAQLLGQAVEIFETRDSQDVFARQKALNNVPMKNSNYYDPKRKYAGEWAFCYSREDLFAIPEYVELQQKAEQGDISAMLDLAIGFLPRRERVWGKEQIVCMPKNRSYYNEKADAIDFRYYYWITRACERSVEEERNGKAYPRKYMATAFFEGLKFIARSNLFPVGSYVSSVRGKDIVWEDPLTLVKALYGDDCFRSASHNEWAVSLIKLLQEYGEEIIDPLHAAHRSPENISFLLACINYVCDCRISSEACGFFKFQGPVMTMEYLGSIRPSDGSCDEYYNACLRVESERKFERERARRLEEQREREKAAREVAIREAAAKEAAYWAGNSSGAHTAAIVKTAPKKERKGLLKIAAIAVVALFAFGAGHAMNASVPVETLDPFEDLEVRAIGAAPDIRIELWNNSLYSFMKNVSFDVSQSEGLDNGDSIRIVANYDKSAGRKAGYQLEPTTMTYTIDQVKWYTRSCEEIDHDVWDAMFAQATDMVEAYVANTPVRDMGNYMGVKCPQVVMTAQKYFYDWGTPDVDRVIFLNAKPGFPVETYNMCCLVLRIPLKIVYSEFGRSEVLFDSNGYFAVNFSNLLEETDGATTVDLSGGTLVGDPKSTLDGIYDNKVSIHKAEYTIEEVLAEELF